MLNISQYGSQNATNILTQGIRANQSQQADVAWQTSTGTVSGSISGLGDTAGESMNLSASLSGIKGYQQNLSSVQSRLSMSSNGLDQMTKLSQSLSTSILNLMSTEGSTRTGIDAASDEAQGALTNLGNILNTNDGSGYIYGGTDNNTKPVTDPSDLMSSEMGKSIQTLLSDGLSADTLKKATAIAGNNDESPFSKSLSVPAQQASGNQVQVIIGANGQSVSNGPVATQGGEASDTSTGSPVRDLMRNLMMVASLKGSDPSSSSYQETMKSLYDSSLKTSDSLIDMNSAVGARQKSLTTRQGAYTSLADMTKLQLSNNLDVNLSAVATRSSDLQTQLKASYMLIADQKNMSLANYI